MRAHLGYSLGRVFALILGVVIAALFFAPLMRSRGFGHDVIPGEPACTDAVVSRDEARGRVVEIVESNCHRRGLFGNVVAWGAHRMVVVRHRFRPDEVMIDVHGTPEIHANWSFFEAGGAMLSVSCKECSVDKLEKLQVLGSDFFAEYSRK